MRAFRCCSILAALAMAGCSAAHTEAPDSGRVDVDAGPPIDAQDPLLDDDAGTLVDSGTTAASTDVVTFTGSGRQQFGGAFAFADLDGDGLDDILLANRSNSDAFVPYRGGSIVILYGRSDRLAGALALASADAEIIGPPHETGDVYLARGDYDGDGIDDVAITFSGAPGEGGSLHILYGSSTRFTGMPFIENVGPTLTPAEDTPALRFGELVRRAGDVDGDGCDDLFVGLASTGSTGGATFVVLGSRTRWSGAATLAPSTTFTPSASGLAGFAFAGAGDLDGDGRDDVLVGEMDDGKLDLGVFYGPIASGTVSMASASAHIVTRSSTWIGILGGLDANSDGLSDFVVPGLAAPGGSMHLFLGSATRLSGRLGTSSAAVALLAAGDDANVGVGVSAGDVDADGRDDLLLGSPNYAAQLGRVDRVYGMPRSQGLAGADQVWLGQQRTYTEGVPGRDTYDEMLGSAVAQDGDFDGDGHDDALLGAASDVVPFGGQRVYFVYGAAR
jgi:hypothetical protein